MESSQRASFIIRGSASCLDFFCILFLVWSEFNFTLSLTNQFCSMRKLTERFLIMVLLLGCCLVFSGCLKTRIITDQTASTEQAELPWAHGFVYGLVPPVNAPLRTEATCGSAGVAEVYFRQTFVQGIAQGLTGSIYSPQRFTVTCAQGGTASVRTPPSYLLEDSMMHTTTSAQATSESTSAK